MNSFRVKAPNVFVIGLQREWLVQNRRMCELLGMSANTPTDLTFSFAGFKERGGNTNHHKDGWGAAFYKGKTAQVFLDPEPCSKSGLAEFLKKNPIRSEISLAHIRKANSGKVDLVNTHPFQRELWGSLWVFAHNGQCKKIKKKKINLFRPIGTTDSEYLFCYLLDRIKSKFPSRPSETILRSFLKNLLVSLHPFGVMNLLFSDSQFLYVFCSTNLHFITRKAPFGKAKLKDRALTIDFSKETNPKDIVTVIATEALTKNEEWNKLTKGDFVVFRKGQRVY